MIFRQLGIIGTVLLTAMAAEAATITSVTLHLSGTFNSAESFLQGDTTDWSTYIGTLTLVNDPNTQTESGGSFPGVASLSLTLLDSSSAVIGSASGTGLDLRFQENLPCPSGCAGANTFDLMFVSVPLTSSIGGLAAGRALILGLAADYQFYIPSSYPLSHYVTQAAYYNWSGFANTSTKKPQVNSDVADVPVLTFSTSVDSVDVVSDVPEPSSALLVLSGVAVVAVRKRWRNRA